MACPSFFLNSPDSITSKPIDCCSMAHSHIHSHSQLHKMYTHIRNNGECHRARTGWKRERKKKVSRLNPHTGTFHIQVTNHVLDVYTTAGKNSSLIHTNASNAHCMRMHLCACVFDCFNCICMCVHSHNIIASDRCTNASSENEQHNFNSQRVMMQPMRVWASRTNDHKYKSILNYNTLRVCECVCLLFYRKSKCISQ